MAQAIQATMDKLAKRLRTDETLQRAFYRDPFRLAADFGVPWKYLEEAERVFYESRIDAQDHLARALSKHDIPLKVATTGPQRLKAAGKPKITVKVQKVLGIPVSFTISLNARVCSDLTSGLLGVTGITGLIAATGALAGPAAAAIAAVISLETAAIGLANRGKGVHYLVTAVQLILPVPPILMASMVPLPN